MEGEILKQEEKGVGLVNSLSMGRMADISYNRSRQRSLPLPFRGVIWLTWPSTRNAESVCKDQLFYAAGTKSEARQMFSPLGRI